jgi:hypothetical protein
MPEKLTFGELRAMFPNGEIPDEATIEVVTSWPLLPNSVYDVEVELDRLAGKDQILIRATNLFDKVL